MCIFYGWHWTVTACYWLKPSSARPAFIRDPNLVITVPADVPAPKGARPSTGTLLTSNWICCFNISLVINSLWPSIAMWQQRCCLTLIWVMTRCLMAPSHYLSQCWLLIKSVPWHSLESNFTRSTHELTCNICLEIRCLKLLPHMPGPSELMIRILSIDQTTLYNMADGILQTPWVLI